MIRCRSRVRLSLLSLLRDFNVAQDELLHAAAYWLDAEWPVTRDQ